MILKEQKLATFLFNPKKKKLNDIFMKAKGNRFTSVSLKFPIQKINNVTTTTLEKLIVDLYSDKKLFAAFQGSELTLHRKYSLQPLCNWFYKSSHYAKRRRKDIELQQFFTDKTDIPKNILNDWLENTFSRMDCWKKEIQ